MALLLLIVPQGPGPQVIIVAAPLDDGRIKSGFLFGVRSAHNTCRKIRPNVIRPRQSGQANLPLRSQWSIHF